MKERVRLDLGQGQSLTLVTNELFDKVLRDKRNAHILRYLKVLLIVDNLADR